ncbi:MAG TPA: hypothetical protein VHA57_09105 [Actinomycetota bacterium]|nr:hypothetical protein [Actinomycetota bacterium]
MTLDPTRTAGAPTPSAAPGWPHVFLAARDAVLGRLLALRSSP